MARRMNLSVPHRLDRDEALLRVKALGDYYRNKYGGSVEWNDHTAHLRVKHVLVTVDAMIEVGPDRVDVDAADVGLLLRSRSLKYVRRKLERYLDPTVPVSALPTS